MSNWWRETRAMSDVALVRCGSYRSEAVSDAIAEALELLGVDLRALGGRKVVVKPNLLVAAPAEAAVTTHPEVVRAIVRMLLDEGATVEVGDSPGFGSLASVAERCGLARICRELGVPYGDFTTCVDTPFPAGRICKRFPLAAAVARADAVINLGKLKTHGLTRYTGAIKNLFGCVVGTHKAEYHLRIQQVSEFCAMLVDLYRCVRPVLSVVDAVMAMEGNGPRSGRPREMGLILASRDAVAVDAVGGMLIGLSPADVPTTTAGAGMGAGCADLREIHVLGLELERARVDGFALCPGMAQSTTGRVPSFARRLARRFLVARPVILGPACRRCGVCEKICPPGAVKVLPTGPRIDERKCIRCYCCQELCPHGAVRLANSWVENLLWG